MNTHQKRTSIIRARCRQRIACMNQQHAMKKRTFYKKLCQLPVEILTHIEDFLKVPHLHLHIENEAFFNYPGRMVDLSLKRIPPNPLRVLARDMDEIYKRVHPDHYSKIYFAVITHFDQTRDTLKPLTGLKTLMVYGKIHDPSVLPNLSKMKYLLIWHINVPVLKEIAKHNYDNIDFSIDNPNDDPETLSMLCNLYKRTPKDRIKIDIDWEFRDTMFGYYFTRCPYNTRYFIQNIHMQPRRIDEITDYDYTPEDVHELIKFLPNLQIININRRNNEFFGTNKYADEFAKEFCKQCQKYNNDKIWSFTIEIIDRIIRVNLIDRVYDPDMTHKFGTHRASFKGRAFF